MAESAYDRRRKMIVEAWLSGFKNANEAIVFGNTVEEVVNRTIGKPIKFRIGIAATHSKLAITEDYTGDTTLKMTFLEVAGDVHHVVAQKFKEVIENYNKEHATARSLGMKGTVNLDREVIRGKPQPLKLGM